MGSSGIVTDLVAWDAESFLNGAGCSRQRGRWSTTPARSSALDLPNPATRRRTTSVAYP